MQEISNLVWDFRSYFESQWPTPSVEDSLAFAITELAEALDAQLRMKPEYNRNNKKDLDYVGELADALIMLLSAYPNPISFDTHRNITLAAAIECAAMALGTVRINPFTYSNLYAELATNIVVELIRMEGEDPFKKVEERLSRIEQRLEKEAQDG